METQSINQKEIIVSNYKRLEDHKYASLFFHNDVTSYGFNFEINQDKKELYKISVMQYKFNAQNNKDIDIRQSFVVSKDEQDILHIAQFQEYSTLRLNLNNLIERARKEVNRKSMTYKFIADMMRLVDLLNGEVA